MGLVNKLFTWYRKHTAKQLHIESYYKDDVWEKLKKSPLDKYDLYIMTPANYSLLKNNHGSTLSHEEMDRKMSKRAGYLSDRFDLGLHVHFWQNSEMPTEKKQIMLDRAINWGEEHGVCFSELVPGWWKFDSDLPELCEDFGLELIDKEASIHDYEL